MVKFFPHGHWNPDLRATNSPVMLVARNVLPQPTGFVPLPGPVAASPQVPSQEKVLDAVSTITLDGTIRSFAGTETKLYELNAAGDWVDVSRTIADPINLGIPYQAPPSDGWEFVVFGDTLVATNQNDTLQLMDLTVGTEFVNLTPQGGVYPARAKYVEVVQDQLLLGNLNPADVAGGQRAVQWSDIGDATEWRLPATNPASVAGSYFLPTGGPLTGLVGGEVGYLMQNNRISQMRFTPGNQLVYQFDEIEREHGCIAPKSIVRMGRYAYYLDDEGFMRMSLDTGATQLIGVNKWLEGWQNLRNGGSDLFVKGVRSPNYQGIIWAFVSAANASSDENDLVVFYDWAIDEATIIEFPITALSGWATRGYTMDNMDPDFPNLDEIPITLDSQFWKGGASLFGAFGTDGRLYFFQGPNMSATLVTGDAELPDMRGLVRAVRPMIDTNEVVVRISAREAESDVVAYDVNSGTMEDTGWCSTWSSGNVFRARIEIPQGAEWSVYTGMDTDIVEQGKR